MASPRLGASNRNTMDHLSQQELISVRQYQYLPLDTTRADIRLLFIPRGCIRASPNGDYTLFRTPLINAPEFVALSYCWGDHALECEVTINGQSMRITENLKIALDNLEDAEQDTWVWADAICINQDDAIEKTTQVQMMREIYRTVSRVIIWLGPSTLGTHDMVREMCKLGDQLIELGLWNLKTEDFSQWTVEDEDTSSVACTKRKVLQLHAEHIGKAQNDENPFWWVGSDLGQRNWFYVGVDHEISLVLS
jgi:hypothetical protein